MSEDKEKLSAFLDGECTAEEASLIFAKLQEDENLKQYWDRYQRASDAIRGTSSPALGLDFAEKVSAAIANEPTILAPNPQKQSASSVTKFLKPVAGFAVAATVASFAIMMVQTNTTDTAEPEKIVATTNQVEVLAAAEPPALATAVKTAAAIPVVSQGTRWDILQPVSHPVAVENTLNNYLVNHHEYAMNRGRQGMMSYARIAGYDTER